MKFSKAFMFLAFLSLTHYGSSQYYRTTVLGNSPKNLNKERANPILDNDPDWTTIFGMTTTPQWSSIQTLPFPFEFNGSSVNTYKVSSTGVLTFNIAATTVPGPIPSALPSTLIPDNSICLWGIQPLDNRSFISHKTFGEPGNRQYWVTFSFCPHGTITLSTWSMVLEEGSNNIYLVEQFNGPGAVTSLSVGIQINSTLAFSDPLSPSVAKISGNDFSLADDMYHRFAPGVQPQKDIELIDFKMPYYVTPGNKIMEGTVHNVGTTTVTNLNISWNDGSGAVTENLSVNIAPDSTYTFTCSNQWNALATPQSLLTLTVTTPSDSDPTNNVYEKPVTVLGTIPTKYVVLEERTGTWCQWCPSGHIAMAELEMDLGSEFIGIAVHNYDPMEISYAEFFWSFIPNNIGWPSIIFDRVTERGIAGLTALVDEFNTRKAFAVPCEVTSVSYSLNTTNNTINISCETNWLGQIRGDYRLSCAIIEDDVIGTSSTWFQANAFAGGTNGPQFPPNVNNGFNFSTAQNPADPAGFGGYDHVARYISKDDLLGDPNSLPAGEIPMGSHSYTFDPIPTAVVNNLEKSKAIVMIIDKYTGDILNAKKISLSSSASIQELAEDIELKIYPNPAREEINVSFNTQKAITNVSLFLYDIHGNEIKKVDSIDNEENITFATNGLADGVYFVHLVSEGRSMVVKKMFVVR